ncbi:magnesium/cobalt transporter CorA [Lacihabitans sp. CS3-21]|uniref:magnesium/cobalt transporter CorA n=1 Tax=Lacihabitans sp. CS3-21 TaxID=2487332 RepID=UPI0020CD1E4D|nr:magnesium/cobalt transporter CorA [Lacihabitans sp. CS3-21]MCP9746898.1 magnesium and cobalt transport protein CorA [Lacihabitans sp. CS3-21]
MGKVKQKNRPKTPKHEVFSSAGTAKYIGKSIEGESTITIVDYSVEGVLITQNPAIEEIKDLLASQMNHWIDIEGIHNKENIEKISKVFELHPLMMEDILNTTQKAKLDYYEKNNQMFLVLKIPFRNKETAEIETEHVSIVLDEKYALSFQELDNHNIFKPILLRMDRENSKTKRSKLDYLFYSFIDIAVDNYFVVLNETEEKLEALSDQILANAKSIHQNQLFYIKREINALRKALFPLKDIINQLVRDEYNLIHSETKVYLKDVLDHVLENLEAIETFKDEIENLLVNYHSQLSNRMNSVMKTLTVFTAIFMPLTFIVGIYGMNFEHMPELKEPNGYFYTLASMFVLSIGLWIYFKWKKYI